MAQAGRSPRTTAPPCHRPHQGQQLPRSKAYRSHPPYRSAPPTTRSHLILFPKTCWIITESREGRTISVRHQHRKRRANGGFLKFVPRLQTIPEEGGYHSCTPSAAGVVGRRRIKPQQWERVALPLLPSKWLHTSLSATVWTDDDPCSLFNQFRRCPKAIVGVVDETTEGEQKPILTLNATNTARPTDNQRQRGINQQAVNTSRPKPVLTSPSRPQTRAAQTPPGHGVGKPSNSPNMQSASTPSPQLSAAQCQRVQGQPPPSQPTTQHHSINPTQPNPAQTPTAPRYLHAANQGATVE
ncbi:hypothetical protein DFP73DRAFT_592063 [Morchella snyderi]|nr:hypothetical protein DFP73DRAFT_592063 [Morchella snyderi]